MIVGAGPAGISTWLHLQKEAPQLAGRSIVIEKAVFPRDKLCAGTLSSWSTNILEHLAVELDIPSLSIGNVEFRFERDLYHFHPPDRFRVIQRVDFDHALAKAAVNRGLELHEDERFINAIRGQSGLLVETNKGKYIVQVLVGADGAFSTVRKKIFPLQKRYLATTLQIFAPADSRYNREFTEKKIIFDLTPINKGLQGYVWHVPCLKYKAPSVAHGISDFRICPYRPRADMKKLFGRELRSRDIHRGPKTWSSHPIPWHSHNGILSQANVILVGDAAGVEPAFGGGIHISLSHGEVAAQAVIDAFQNDDFFFRDYPERVQSHEVGRFIAKCTRLAMEIYGGKMNPLHAVREFFATEYEWQNLLLRLLLKA
jgi:flavin-dependent dehydrogenase